MTVICKTFRIGVFFDGTGNNKANDFAADRARARQRNLPTNKQSKKINEANAPSNVAKLSKLYPNGETLKGQRTNECEIATKMIYIEGLGTIAGKDNYNTGMAGGSKGALRINDAIKQVKDALDAHGEKEFNRVIDVFGFSRGAAQARDFINTFMARHGKKVKNFKFGFVGIYDTVGSFGLGGNNIDYKPKDPTKDSEMHPDVLAYEAGVSRPGSPSQRNFFNKFEEYNFNLSAKSADKIVHLTASDEYRENFPLTNIQGSGGLEAKMIGVHSDIGGGYPPLSDESDLHDKMHFRELSYYRNNSRGLSRLLSSDRGVENPIELTREAAKKKEEELGRGYKCSINSVSHGGVTRAWVVCTQRHDITDDLQNVGLASMHSQAVQSGVPLKSLPNINVPSDLQNYYTGTIRSPISAANYSPRDPILNLYAHRSSYDSKNVHHGRDSDGAVDWISMEMRYEHNKPRREIYGNVPAKAETV